MFRDGQFVESGNQFWFPDDVTLGYIIGKYSTREDKLKGLYTLITRKLKGLYTLITRKLKGLYTLITKK